MPRGDVVEGLSRYEFGGRLGRGGDAEVWAATEPLTGAEVAVKRLVPSGSADQEPRLFREYQVLRDLDVPGIPRARGLGRDDDGRAYLVMDRCPGTAAGRWAHATRDGSAASTRAIAATLGRAAALVAEVHAAGIVHGDLKPSGFIVDGARVALVDFGASRPADGARLVGHIAESYTTAAYAALDILERRGSSTAGDVWSLSAIACRMLLGDPPFGDGSRAEVRARITTAAVDGLAARLAALVPADAVAAIRDGFARDPARRPDAAAWRDALGGVPVEARSATGVPWPRCWPAVAPLPASAVAARACLDRGAWSDARALANADEPWSLVGLAELELELGHLAVAADAVTRLDAMTLDANLVAKRLALGLQLATARGEPVDLERARAAFEDRPPLAPGVAVDLAAALAISALDRDDATTASHFVAAAEALARAAGELSGLLTAATVRALATDTNGLPVPLPTELVAPADDAGLLAALMRLHLAAGAPGAARTVLTRFAGRLAPAESMPLRLAPWLVEASRVW